jgi:hypothetical protein
MESVLHCGAVDLRHQTAHPGQCLSVKADAVADRGKSCDVLRECLPRPPQTWMPSAALSGAPPRFSAVSWLLLARHDKAVKSLLVSWGIEPKTGELQLRPPQFAASTVIAVFDALRAKMVPTSRGGGGWRPGPTCSWGRAWG